MHHLDSHGPGRSTDLHNLVLMAFPTPAVRDALHALRDIVAGIALEPLELSLTRPAALEDFTVMPARPNKYFNAWLERGRHVELASYRALPPAQLRLFH